jgi:proteic killer suppression protein
LKVSFKNKKTAKEFSESRLLEKKHGNIRAKKIRVRLAALHLFAFWPPLRKPERCHELTGGKRAGQISMDLDHPNRLIFVPDHEPLPQREEGGLDWERATAIIIMGIEDTHG